MEHQILPKDYNSYGARRGNHEVMMRGTFGNIRINEMYLKPKVDLPTIPRRKNNVRYEASLEYKKRQI